MIERIVIIDSADPVSFYGVNNSNMQLIRNLFPKLRMAARGSVIKVIGDDAETSEFHLLKIKVAYGECVEVITCHFIKNFVGIDAVNRVCEHENLRKLRIEVKSNGVADSFCGLFSGETSLVDHRFAALFPPVCNRRPDDAPFM